MDEKENWLGVKYVRERYNYERFRSIRQKFVLENRKKFENIDLQNNSQFVEVIEKMKSLMNELNTNQKLKSCTSRETKGLLLALRNLSKQDQRLFTAILENEVFLVFHRYVLEHERCSLDLKHDTLWNIAIASNFKLSKEKAEYLASSVLCLTGKLGELHKMDQVVFLEKMLFALTNFLLDHSSVGALLQNDKVLQKHARVLLDEHSSYHISLGLWFIRNLLKITKSAFEECLIDYSIQNSIFIALKNYSDDKDLLFEIIWTLTQVSEMDVQYQILNSDLLMAVLEITKEDEEFMLTPILSILGNAFTSLSEESIKSIIYTAEFSNVLQKSLLSNNFMVKRECLFLLSNMAAKSGESAGFILQKEDLVEFLKDLLKKEEPHMYKEALYIIFNLCYTSSQYCSNGLQPSIKDIFLPFIKVSNGSFIDEEIRNLHNQICNL